MTVISLCTSPLRKVSYLGMLRFYNRPTIQETSTVTNKSKSVVLHMIDSLQKKGLVTRTINPEDRREKFLDLTELGKSISKQNLDIKSNTSKGLLKNIPEEDVAVFLKIAGSMSRNADKILNQKMS